MVNHEDPSRRSTVQRTQAYERFMRTLTIGTIKPGQLLSQREICDLLEMPLGAVREALKRLEAENLVELVPRRGIRIADIDEAVVDEVYHFRRLIEHEALRAFLEDVPTVAVRQLRQRTRDASAIERTATTIAIEDSLWMTDLDHEMHFMFIRAMKNRFVYASFERLMAQLRLVRFLNRIRLPRKHNALEEHITLIDLVLDGRSADAEDALASHLNASHARAKGLS